MPPDNSNNLDSGRSSADAHILGDCLGAACLGGAVNHSMARNRIQKSETVVFAQSKIEKHALAVTIVRNKANSGATKGARAVAGDLCILDPQLAAAVAIDTRGRANEFALAFAFDAGQADYLAGIDDEIDVVETAAAQSINHKQWNTERLRLGGKICPSGRPAISDTISADVIEFGQSAVDNLSIAHYRYAIGQFVDLVQPVRYVDDADAVAFQFANEVEQLSHITVLQRLGRLIEKKHSRIRCKRARDLDDVALRERKLGNALADWHAQFVCRDPRQKALGLGATPGPPSEGAASWRFSKTVKSGAKAGC